MNISDTTDLSGEIYRHIKTGHCYEVLGMGLIEATKDTSVIYRQVDSDTVWIRPVKEFFDGRFQCIEQNEV